MTNLKMKKQENNLLCKQGYKATKYRNKKKNDFVKNNTDHFSLFSFGMHTKYNVKRFVS